MNKSVYKFLAVLLVSVFGLFSCAKEKAASPVPDSFTLGVPKIHSVGTTLYASNKVISGSDFSPESRIEFPGLASVNGRVRLTTETFCRGSGEVHEGRAQFLGVSNIRVLDLLPVTAFNPVRGNEILQCIVNVVGENSHGSRHSLTIPVVSINLSTLREDLSMHVDTRRLDEEKNPVLSESEASRLRVLNMRAMKSYDHSHLVCEGQYFSANHLAVMNYGFATLLASGGIAYEGKPFQSFAARPRQKCRVVFESASPSRSVELSAAFYVQFPSAKPTIKVRKFFPQVIQPNARQLALEIEIANGNSFDLAVALPKQMNNDLLIRPVTEHGHGVAGYAFPARFVSLNWETNASSVIYNSSKLQKFKLAAGKSVLIRAYAQIDFFCRMNAENTAGFFYDIIGDGLQLWVSKTNSYSADANVSDSITIPLLPRPVDPMRVNLLPGWHAFDRETREKLNSPRGVSGVDNDFFVSDLGKCGWRP